MKLSTIYSNKDASFPRISFHDGLNVVFGRVQDPTARERDSHNLGKTFLITVLDFCLLADVDRSHPFRVHNEAFHEFIFFLEILTHTGQHVTVRREVAPRTSVCLHLHDEEYADLQGLPISDWAYTALPISRARGILNGILDLSVISPYDFRKGLGYVMRSQRDYAEVFRISKFATGRDEYWKPFLAQVLGFDHDAVVHKYELDNSLAQEQSALQLLEQEAGSRSDEYDELRGLVEINRSAAQRLRAQVDAFSFREFEAEINDRLVGEIEVQIAAENRRRYVIDYELGEINRALQTQFELNLHRLAALFDEADLHLPDALIKSYEEAVEFNRRLTTGRRERLQDTRTRLLEERKGVEQRIAQLDAQRVEAVMLLEAQETIEKFRALQAEYMEKRAQVLALEARLSQLDRAGQVQERIEELRRQIADAVQRLKEMVRGEVPVYREIRTTFAGIVEAVLSAPALMSVVVNQSGNLDFNVRTLDRDMTGRETSEALGTSYRKLLCACFDLAVVETYASRPFYHFLYHDGVLEGLDNRKKVSLLEAIRSACANHGIRYILTVIDSDIPRDERDNRLLFTSNEVVRELHDQGESGRLFRMAPF